MMAMSVMTMSLMAVSMMAVIMMTVALRSVVILIVGVAVIVVVDHFAVHRVPMIAVVVIIANGMVMTIMFMMSCVVVIVRIAHGPYALSVTCAHSDRFATRHVRFGFTLQV